MKEAVIVSYARTGLAKSHRGSFNNLEVPSMVAAVIRAVIERAGVEPGEVEDVIEPTVALELENGTSLRVNSSSEVELVAADRVVLRSGTVYFDSKGESASGSFAVETELGSVRHVGTQFEASLVGSGLRIRVREGAVMFNSPTRELIASAGEVVSIDGAGAAQREAITTDDDEWRWAEDLAILPVAEEYSLPDVLAWISRETGREVRFADAAVQARVQTIVVYDLGNLTPEETLGVLRSTTAFEYRETDDGLLVVSSNR